MFNSKLNYSNKIMYDDGIVVYKINLNNVHFSCYQTFCVTPFHTLLKIVVQSRLAITRLAIMRIGYNAVGRGARISAARGEMGATANNNAVINCHLFL